MLLPSGLTGRFGRQEGMIPGNSDWEIILEGQYGLKFLVVAGLQWLVGIILL